MKINKDKNSQEQDKYLMHQVFEINQKDILNFVNLNFVKYKCTWIKIIKYTTGSTYT